MSLRRHRSPLLPLVALLLAVAAVSARRAQEPAPERALVLVPFLPDEVRILRAAEAGLMVYNPSADGAEVHLEALEVLSEGDLLTREDLGRDLPGDPRFGEVNALIERLPHQVSHLHRQTRHFAAPDAPELGGEEALSAKREAAARWSALAAEYETSGREPFTQVDFTVPYDQLFFADAPPGSEATIELRLVYRDASGARRARSVTTRVTRLPALRGLPQTLSASLGAPTSVHVGDLHVHSCHGEAAGACAPSSNCTAETLQLSGSFSYAQLKGQYQALGYDWFSATDHSYCINSTSEFQTIQAECAAATDSSFLVLADMELSSDEVGPQIGSDLGDAVCLGSTSANHMGAHGISTRIPGGEDGLFGFCDGLFSDVLDPFPSNVAAVRAQGGYPIANHPDGSSFAWNSAEAAVGIEAGGLHGVEIWNGATQAGQGGNVGRWVDWLLDGRLLYAYSGSDTHDEAFAFGGNHVLLTDEPFTIENLHAALRAGQCYVSNEHSLVVEVGLGGSTLLMGAMQPVPSGSPAAPLTPRVHYDFGSDSATITVFAGRAGDASETVLCTSPPLSGAGVFTCSATLETSAQSWIRAYSESGSKTAYTNPVFFVPLQADPARYCAAKLASPGCSPTTTWQGSASATSGAPFIVGATDVVNGQNGIFFYGYAPSYTPFQGGTLCVAPAIKRTPVQNAGGPAGTGCDGSFSYDLNARIQSGVDPGLAAGVTVYGQHWFRDPGAPSGSGLSDAVQVTIGP